jgi:hypothetical protein
MTLDKLESQVIALNGGGGNPSGAVNTNGILKYQNSRGVTNKTIQFSILGKLDLENSKLSK